MKLSIVLISNPAAKKASDRKVAMASYYLQSKGCTVEALFTEKRGDAESLAKEAIKKSPSLVIAAGGDGTINEVINGITGTEIPLAILPLGTTNVLAKELGIPETVEASMKIAISHTPKSISLGKIVYTSYSSLITRYFCLMAGIGFDGESVFRISEAVKKMSGKGAYILSGLKTLTGFNPEQLTFSINGMTYAGYSAIIGNAAKYGGHFRVTPDARLTDPFLYVCLFKGKKRLDLIRYVLGIVTGRHLAFKDIEYLKAGSIEIQGRSRIQIDGDYLGMTPAKIGIVPNALRLIF
ncbi:MAG: diacylglycerol kinase family lipid kinase [Nitrospira sp.]|nr:diacylglycerol kinase family lipid kinase [Nitrospira sp.]